VNKCYLEKYKLDRELLAPCGAYCGSCSYFLKERTPHCSACGTHKGHPFWGECKLYACASEHKVEHCGVCSDFPCDLFVEHFDPESGQKSALLSAGLLEYRKKVGTEKDVELVKKLKE